MAHLARYEVKRHRATTKIDQGVRAAAQTAGRRNVNDQNGEIGLVPGTVTGSI